MIWAWLFLLAAAPTATPDSLWGDGSGAGGRPLSSSKAPYSLLRQRLREKLKAFTEEPAAPAAAQRYTQAINHLNDVIKQASSVSDGGQAAQLRLDYQAAIEECRNASAAAVKDAPSDQRAALEAATQRILDDAASRSQQASLVGDSAPARENDDASVAATPAVAPAPDSTPSPAEAPPQDFSFCYEADNHGLRDCYNAPRYGYFCRKSIESNGDRIWTDEQPTCESEDFLKRRNAFFAAQDYVGDFSDASSDAPAGFALRGDGAANLKKPTALADRPPPKPAPAPSIAVAPPPTYSADPAAGPSFDDDLNSIVSTIDLANSLSGFLMGGSRAPVAPTYSRPTVYVAPSRSPSAQPTHASDITGLSR